MPLDLTTFDHAAQALARLPSYLQKQRWQDLLTVLADEVAEVDDALVAVATQLHLDEAEGDMLDLIGDEVNEDRNGLEDDDYRYRIRLRIFANRSRGLAEDVITLARYVVDEDAKTIALQTLGVASAQLTLGGTATTEEVADTVTAYCRRAVSAGVRLGVAWSEEADAGTFRFAGSGTPTLLRIVAHGLTTGAGPFTLTTTGTLPAPLTTGTDYYAIVEDADHFQLAWTRAAALADTAIDMSSTGTGTHTLVTGAAFDELALTDNFDFTTSFGDNWAVFNAPRLYQAGDGPWQASTDGTLPGGMFAATDYWVCADQDGGSYPLATSRANALANIAITLTDDGTGTHTFTAQPGALRHEPVALADSTFTAIAGTQPAGLGFAGTPPTLDLGPLLTGGSGYDAVLGYHAFGASHNGDYSLTFVHDAGAPNAGTLDESTPAAIVFTFKGGTTDSDDFEAAIAASEYLFIHTANTAGVVGFADTVDEFTTQTFTGATGGDGGVLATVQE
jgi:hypothetical protein